MMTDAREKSYLRSFVAEASRGIKSGDIYLYPSGNGESPKIGVIYGTFESRQEATQALMALPEKLRQFRPYVRTVDAVRADLRRPAAG
jgi:septal ring-binding cell division protein DamX